MPSLQNYLVREGFRRKFTKKNWPQITQIYADKTKKVMFAASPQIELVALERFQTRFHLR